MIPVEICIDCSDLDAALASASAAHEGGASRIECCAAMHTGGLTPEVSTIEQISLAFESKIEILAMIRPKSGNFHYSPSEINQMLESISDMAEAGAHGVVFGVVLDGALDSHNLNKLVRRATENGLLTTFHRAYDALSKPQASIEALKAANINRVLTSGVSWGDTRSALHGIDGLNQTLTGAGNGFEVVVGGGISSENASSIQNRLSSYGSRSFHAYSSVLKDGLTDVSLVRDLVGSLTD